LVSAKVEDDAGHGAGGQAILKRMVILNGCGSGTQDVVQSVGMGVLVVPAHLYRAIVLPP